MTTAIERETSLPESPDDEPLIEFEIIGVPHGPVVAVLGGISSTRHVARSRANPESGWWESTVGEGKAIDTAVYRVLSIDYLTASPDGDDVSTFDQANALARVLDRIGVARLHGLVGASYGGMVALAFAARYGERAERFVVIGAAHESDPLTTALRVSQRRVVELGMATGEERAAIAIARGIAMTTCATREQFGTQFASDGHDPRTMSDRVERHLISAGERFADSCGAERYLALSRSIDHHRVDIEDIRVAMTLIAVQEDSIVPIPQVRELARRLGARCKFVEVRSVNGHDAFLEDPDRIAQLIADAFKPAGRNVVSGPTAVTAKKSEASPVTIETPRANLPSSRHAATRAVRAGIATDLHHGAVVPPIHLSSTFSFDGFNKKRKYDYTRSGNPTRDHLAVALAELEGGAASVVTSTGMSAVAVVLQLVRPGDLVVAAHDCYGGTHRIPRSLAERGQFNVAFVDLTSPDAERIIGTRRPRLLWIETPSNPLLRVTDLNRIVAAGHFAGATVAVDNTFLSPALQRPIEFGADVVVHSTTKYLNGHSDVVGGAVIAADPALAEELAW